MALRRRAQGLLAVVLPALVLRALIPFGFMPVAGSSGPAMELCPGASAMSDTSIGHQHHHGAPGGATHTLCVFAASAAPAVAPAVQIMPLHAAKLSALQHTGDCLVHLPSILRTQSARAPPSLA